MDLVVRPALVEDIDDLAVLNQVVQKLHAGAEPTWFKANTDTTEVKSFFENILNTANMFVLIAETSGRPAGYIWFELQERAATPFTNARKRIYIHHVVVDHASRKAGVGSSLLRAAEAEGQGRGVTQIALDTWSFNEGALKFFRATSFKQFNIVMRKDLGESA